MWKKKAKSNSNQCRIAMVHLIEVGSYEIVHTQIKHTSALFCGFSQVLFGYRNITICTLHFNLIYLLRCLEICFGMYLFI
jgi:hypothetical protein